MPKCPYCNKEFESSIKYALPSEQEIIERNRAIYRSSAWYNKYGWTVIITFIVVLFMSLDIWRWQMSEGLGYVFGVGLVCGGCIIFTLLYSLTYFRSRSYFKFLTERMERGGYDTKKLGSITFLEGFKLKFKFKE